jgi:uracil-DNA glycosylase
MRLLAAASIARVQTSCVSKKSVTERSQRSRPSVTVEPLVLQSEAGDSLEELAAEIAACRRCPRLVAWREEVAQLKRASFRGDQYWGRPVPGFGDPDAAIYLLGLAPAAHGANRTGRLFTGDRSGDWLFRAMHRAGLANQPTSTDRNDGLVLTGAWIGAAVRCAPPGNSPTPDERDRCRPFFVRELAMLPNVSVIIALGKFAYDIATTELAIRPRPKFGHGVVAPGVGPHGQMSVVASFHPSQQNTFTGKLTEPMLDAVMSTAQKIGSSQGHTPY